MSDNKAYQKLKRILNFVESEANKPLEDHNYETHIWSEGYKKAMTTVKNFIWAILNKDNE